MKMVWITGACGFIGKHLARKSAQLGYVVFGIGHGHWPETEAIKWGVKGWLNGEIEAVNLTELLIRSANPQVIYHLAGGSSVGASFENPLEDYRRTVDTTARLLDWIRSNCPDTKVVLVSSAAVYGAGHEDAISENSTLMPYSPYGFNKAIMEMLCRSYVENFGLTVVVVRLFSVYGEGLRKQLLWDLCSKLESEGKAVLGGTGKELRDWLHVSDVAELLVMASELRNSEMRCINGGAGIGVSVREVAQMVCDVWGGGVSVDFSGLARKGDPVSLVANVARSSEIYFAPKITLEVGIGQYVSWFKSVNKTVGDER